MSFTILAGDCIESMRGMEAGSVQCCVTSPPYFGLRAYLPDDSAERKHEIGREETPAEFVAKMVEVFAEVWRVLRDDGTLWVNLGDSYNNFRSQMGPGQAVHGRDKLNGKPDVLSKRRGTKGLKEKELIGIPWRVAFALQDAGWHLRQDIIWHKPNPMPESVRDRCTKAHEYLFLLTKKPSYYFNGKAIKEAATNRSSGNLEAKSRPGQAALKRGDQKGSVPCDGAETRNRRSVWTVAARAYKGAHFATYPPELITPCILAGSPPGDLVLDPFGGSGTTAAVALAHGRSAVLCELNPEYVALAESRVAATLEAMAKPAKKRAPKAPKKTPEPAAEPTPQIDLFEEVSA